MRPSPDSLSEVISALTSAWERQDVACPPPEEDVREVAKANGVRLPADFVQLYRAVNGTPELYPNELDENYCSFLPVEALRTEEKVWRVRTAEAETPERAGVTVFVDFMHRSWEYGFLAEANGREYRIGRLPGGKEFHVLTTSLNQFLRWYVEDADELYG